MRRPARESSLGRFDDLHDRRGTSAVGWKRDFEFSGTLNFYGTFGGKTGVGVFDQALCRALPGENLARGKERERG